MTWIDDVKDALKELGGRAHLSQIYPIVRSIRVRRGARLGQLENWVRYTLQQNSRGKGEHLFEPVYPVEQRKGIWKLKSTPPEIEERTPVAVDLGDVLVEPPDMIEVRTFRALRDTKLTMLLKFMYSNKCQICGATIHLRNRDYSEAHHLQPLGKKHNGVDAPQNIIILCPNHHVEFDYGVIAIDPDRLTVVHREPDNPLSGRKITLNSAHELDKRYLVYHLNSIFNK